MQHGSFGGLQRFGNNAVCTQRKQIAHNAPRAVYPLDFFIGRGLEPPDPVPAQHFHHQAVKILRAAADHDLFLRHPDTPVAGQIAAQGFPQRLAAGVRRLDQQCFAVVRKHPAHHLCQRRKGKSVASFCPGQGNRHGKRPGGGNGKAVPVPVGNPNAAAGPGFGVAFFAKQFNPVIHGDFAEAPVPRQGPPGGQPRSGGADAREDFLPQGFIQSQIGRLGGSHLV